MTSATVKSPENASSNLTRDSLGSLAAKPLSTKSRTHGPTPKRRRTDDARSKPQEKPQRRRRRGLPRPKRPVTFTLPEHLNPPASTASDTLVNQATKPTRSRSATPTVSDTPLLRLSRINILLTAIHRRNRNQHRTQPFYKHLNYLRRAVTRLIQLHSQAPETPAPNTNASTARLRFERQAEQRSHREAVEEWTRETLVPGCHVAFTGLVADTQFANLGVVLVGVLADVADVVGLMKRVDPVAVARRGAPNTTGPRGTPAVGAATVEGLSTVITGPGQGEVVRRVYRDGVADVAAMAVDLGTVVERSFPPRDTETPPTTHDPDVDGMDVDPAARQGQSNNATEVEEQPVDYESIAQGEAKPTRREDNTVTAKRKSKDKKKKSRNAIDDLFSGFG